MRSPHFLASSAVAQAIATALAAGLAYMFIGRVLDPDGLHLGAAVVIGMTVGIHIYRRARVRIASAAYRQRQISG